MPYLRNEITLNFKRKIGGYVELNQNETRVSLKGCLSNFLEENQTITLQLQGMFLRMFN
jgi:hypothetical protein